MRKLLYILLPILLASTVCRGAWVLKASTVKQSADGNSITSTAIDTTGADLIVIHVSWLTSGGADITLSDNKGNTFTGLTGQAGTNNVNGRLFYCGNGGVTVGTGHTFTVAKVGGALPYPSFWVEAWSGSATSSVFDKENGSFGGAATTVQPGSVTPTNNGSLIIAGLAQYDGATINSGFTAATASGLPAGSIGGGIAYLTQVSAAAVNPTWTASANPGLQDYGALIAVFKPLPNPPPDAPSNFTVTSTSSTTVGLSWTDSGAAYTGHTLQYDVSNSFPSPISIDIPSGTTQSAILSLAPLTTYYFRVLAYNGGGNSSYSSTVSTTTLVPSTGPNRLNIGIGIGLSALIPRVPYADSDVIGRAGFAGKVESR